MVTAFVLINARRDMIPETAESLAELKEISEVYSITGEYDLIAIIRVQNNEELAHLVTHTMLKMRGIEKSETLLAFRAYSDYDLERMFSIGLEEPDSEMEPKE